MIITVQQAKSYLNLDFANSKFDLEIESFIKTAKQKIINICNQDLLTNTVTREVSIHKPKDKILLLNKPVNSITSLKYRALPTDSYTTINVANYKLILIDGFYYLYYPSGFLDGVSNYQIIYSAGYTTATMPEIVKRVVKEMVAVQYMEAPFSQHARIGVASRADSGLGLMNINTTFKDEMPKWQDLLIQYKMPVYFE